MVVDGPLQRLMDIEEIKQLKARYFRLYDSRRWEEFRELFTDDVHVWIEGFEHSYDNADDFVESAIERNTTATGPTVHHGHMPEIEITGDGTATGIWAMFDFIDRVSAEAGTRLVREGYGWYEEQYRKDNGSWKIASMRVTRIRVDDIPGAARPPFPQANEPM